jgi:two-component system response regulator VicR
MYKILYIEDEAFLAKIVKESLERLGHSVCHLPDGRNINQTYRDFKPDLCVLDIMLPHKNGYELARELRVIDKHIPIIFLTAKSQTEDLVSGFEAGGNDYIRKPFSIEELQVRIQSLIEITSGNKSASSTQESIQLGKYYTFHVKKQQLIYNETIRNLSHKESSILNILCKSINGSTDRKEILLKVWNDDSYFNSRNLDVYIRKLRSYLDNDHNLKIITLKGVGYHFSVE